MSTIPLSARDQEAPEGLSHYGGIAPENRPDAGAEKRLDAVIDKALEHFPDTDEEPVNQNRGIDSHVTESLEKYEASKADAESFQKSRETRAEIHSRYEGGNLKQTIQSVLHLGALYKKDPAEATATFIRSYRGMNPWSLKAESKPAPETFVDGFGRRHSGQYLSHIIDQAQERAPAERSDYEATPKEREQLRQLFGGKPFDECLKIVAELDKAAIQDPDTVGLRLNQMFGGPETPEQVHELRQAKADRAYADQAVTQAEKVLPGMHDPVVRQTMAAAIEGGHANNLEDANRIAIQFLQHQHQQKVEGDRWTVSQLYDLAQHDSVVAAQIVEVLSPKSPDYVQHIASMSDPVSRLHAAAAFVQSKAAAAKAAKVRPVKTSPGVVPQGTGKGMDSAIAAAMSKHSW